MKEGAPDSVQRGAVLGKSHILPNLLCCGKTFNFILLVKHAIRPIN
jgi:hypothetical protein